MEHCQKKELDSKFQNLSSSAFKEYLIMGIRPASNSKCNIHNLISSLNLSLALDLTGLGALADSVGCEN